MALNALNCLAKSQQITHDFAKHPHLPSERPAVAHILRDLRHEVGSMTGRALVYHHPLRWVSAKGTPICNGKENGDYYSILVPQKWYPSIFRNSASGLHRIAITIGDDLLLCM